MMTGVGRARSVEGLGRQEERAMSARQSELRSSRLVPLAGIEPALLAELDFESSASTSSATGAFGRGPEGPVRRSGRNIAGGASGSTRADVIVARLDTLDATGYDAGACLSMDPCSGDCP